MFEHYLATALRHFARHKVTTAINVACLWFGLAAFTIAYGITAVYFHMDLHHEKAKRTYFITQDSRFKGGAANTGPVVAVGAAIAPHLKTDFPELETVARITANANTAIAANGEKKFGGVMYADPDALEVLDFEFAAGDRRTALRTPRSAVISEQLARALFKDRDPMGQTVLLNGHTEVHITGVAKESTPPAFISPCCSPTGSWNEFSLLVDWSTADSVRAARDGASAQTHDQYFQDTAFTYAVFKDSGALTPEHLRGQLDAFSARNVPAERGKAILGLRHISEMMRTFLDTGVQTHRSGLSFVMLVLGSGILILCIACLNYANLASAQAATRLKELALLRAIGASRSQIIAQVFFEALLAVIVATALLLISIPGIDFFLSVIGGGIDYRKFVARSPEYWRWLVIAMISTAVLASIYPAMIMTRVRLAEALHSGRTPIRNRRLMQWIVVGQCVTASLLLIFTDIMSAQNRVSGHGFDSADSALLFISNDLRAADVDPLVLKDELRTQSVVKSIGAANGTPGGGFPFRMVMTRRDPSSKSFVLFAPTVDDNFFSTMGIKLLAGRNFDKSITSDLATDELHGNVIIDAALASRLGWNNPTYAIGKEIFVPANSTPSAIGIPHTVVGVVESKMLTPFVFGTDASQFYSFNPAQSTTVVVRIARDNVKAGLAAVTSAWDRLAPNTPLATQFVDQAFQRAVGAYTALTLAGRGLGFLALFIASMGIMGIAIHAIAQRTFEIGVRKALGARLSRIIAMLLKDFSKPVVLANLIAWPFAYLLGAGYATLFTNPISVTAIPFIGSLAFGLGIAWLAIGRQAYRAAKLNPATVLRHE